MSQPSSEPQPPARAESPAAASPREVGIVVQRSARYYVAGDDGDAPPSEIWLVVHGYAQLAARFVRPFLPLTARGRVVVAPEGLSRFYVDPLPARMRHEEPRVGASWMTREDRGREIVDQIAYLDRVVEDVRARWPGAAPRLVVLGFSQGVATVTRWLASPSAPRADRVILWAGSVPPELEPDAARRALGDGRLTIVAATDDPLVPAERLKEDAARLEALGIPATITWFEGGHVVDEFVVQRVARAR